MSHVIMLYTYILRNYMNTGWFIMGEACLSIDDFYDFEPGAPGGECLRTENKKNPLIQKKGNPARQMSGGVLGARNRTRTCTTVRSLVPETSVSTNFTIRADGSFYAFFAILVPRTRLELAHPKGNQPLKLACLPISPPGQRGCKNTIFC